METARTCRACGAPLADGAESCPRCLFRLALPPDAPAPAAATGASEPDAPRPEPPTLDEIARALPEFDEFEWLGRGGMGVVYRARQKKLERRVALKVLPRALGERPEFRERFLREARALARLSHPNIVAVHDFGTVDGLCYFVMELVDGVNLRTVLRERRLAPAETLAIVRALCDALQYAHDEGVVHRDIKPENVLVDRNGRVRVADFGLAKVIGGDAATHLTGVGQVVGTPHYMAPEQLERPLDVDHRADLFALGVVLYEMLTGSLPRGTFEPPSQRVHVDVRLDEIVVKALEREPARRYQHAIEVKSDVEHVEAGESPPIAHADAPARAAQAPTTHTARVQSVDPVQTASEGRGALRALALSGLGWISVGACWNAGPFVFGLASIAFIVLAGWILRERIARSAEITTQLGELPRRERVSRTTSAAVLVALALGALALFHVAHWERSTHAWSPAFRGALGALEALRADPLALVRSGGTVPEPGQNVVIRTLRSATSEPVSQLFTSSAWPLFVIAFTLAVCAAFVVVRPRARGPLTRTAWHVSFDAVSYVFGSLVILWVAAPMFALRSETRLASVERRFTVEKSPDEISRALGEAVRAAGLAVAVDQSVSAIDERTAVELARVNLLRAEALSPFERWSTSFLGPQRATPQVWATIQRSANAHTSYVTLRAGLYAVDSEPARDAERVLAELEDTATAP